MASEKKLQREAIRLARILAEKQLRVVFAESCTAGLVAASLGGIAGISDYLCGSAVVYREATKRDWLAIPRSDLEKYSAVSEPIARHMAVAVLEKTLEAHWSVSVTGHLGPGAPEPLDGLVFVAVASRENQQIRIAGTWRCSLRTTDRLHRQQEAAELVLKHLCQSLGSGEDSLDTTGQSE